MCRGPNHATAEVCATLSYKWVKRCSFRSVHGAPSQQHGSQTLRRSKCLEGLFDLYTRQNKDPGFNFRLKKTQQFFWGQTDCEKVVHYCYLYTSSLWSHDTNLSVGLWIYRFVQLYSNHTVFVSKGNIPTT